MHKILRFEKPILTACEKHLKDVLELLRCKIAFHVLLVGMDTESISVRPDDAYLSEADIGEHFTPPEQPPQHPSDELEEGDWHTGYQAFDKQCWEWWSELRDAVNTGIAHRGMLASVSPTVEVDGKVVALVVIFSETDCMSYPTSSMDVFTNHGRWPSLQFGVIEAVLKQFAEELDKRNPGRGLEYEPFDPQQTLRIAGEFFMRMHSWAGKRFSAIDIQFRGTPKLFDACNIIASFSYEKREGLGGMIVADRVHPAVETVLEYKYPMLVNAHRRVRKLLEMCGGGLYLLCDSRFVWGLGRFDKSKYDPSSMEVCTVEFKGHHHWQMSHVGTVLMDVRYGHPNLPQSAMDMNIVRAALTKQFGEGFDASTLCKVVNIAIGATHGAVVVISKDAAAECERLVGHLGIHSFAYDREALVGAMSIDGAIMVDPQAVCHGVGLILDGTLGAKENPERGARYNSVRRYMIDHPDCVIVLVSEDGMINVFPND
ncbi:MAG TPA: hypothetical protein VMM56_15765 [Planctomycetaceae bacterium]|nr:hypothetical protein [Planctomycetaceae bacterium]